MEIVYRELASGVCLRVVNMKKKILLIVIASIAVVAIAVMLCGCAAKEGILVRMFGF